MKKLITLILTAAMVLTLGTMSVLAAPKTDIEPANGDVNAKYNAGSHAATYSIDITWGAMQFNYEAHEAWNTEDHKWEPNEPTWAINNDSNTITVANNSSVAIDAEFGFTKEAAYTELTGGTFSSDSNLFHDSLLALPVAAADESAIAHTVTFLPAGPVPSTLSGYTKIGTITITLTVPQP